MPVVVRKLNWLLLASTLALTSCGYFPQYETQWFVIPGQAAREKFIAEAICEPVADGAQAKAELLTNWPKTEDYTPDTTVSSYDVASRAKDVRGGAMTACMAEQGWYPERVCVAN